MYPAICYDTLLEILSQQCEAYATLTGSQAYPDISGTVEFYPLWGGTLVAAVVSGLPDPGRAACGSRFHGFHIHEGASCAEADNSGTAFPLTGDHYNPRGCKHPAHSGDLAPLISGSGYAFQICYTDAFVPEEVFGKTVVIHSMPDDFTTQPSGDSGTKIACGEIKSVWEEN